MEQVENKEPSNVFRRKFPRRRYFKPVGVLYRGEYWICECEEIGEGGMRLSSPVSMIANSPVILSVIVPGSNDIAITRSLVVYQREDLVEGGFRYGLQFSKLEFKSKKKIRDYISQKTEVEAMEDQEFLKIELFGNILKKL